jgi:flagellar hook-basal body complex protein FliE
MDSISSIWATSADPAMLSISPSADLMKQTAPSGAAPTGTSTFAGLVTQGLQEVNQQLAVSQLDLQQLAAGEVQSLHQIMIRMEESRLSFQLLMQVRSRLLEAYQEVMRMSV